MIEEQEWKDNGFCEHQMYKGEMCSQCLEAKDQEISALKSELEKAKAGAARYREALERINILSSGFNIMEAKEIARAALKETK